MRFSDFPRFHRGSLLCKQAAEIFQNRTKTPGIRQQRLPQNPGDSRRRTALSCVKRGRGNFFPTDCPQGFNIHFTCWGKGGGGGSGEKLGLGFSPVLWYTSGKSGGFPACFHKNRGKEARFPPKRAFCINIQ